ncbi:phytoene/squalene synthase family protein [Metallosphaera javensis (ex Sakai et al. 2022)]|uniref:phytoene/squalene synthase family protein n=1 Tax=Metallosphaera javensis (ex Sakai et al. 2022) TaxID=2775498 RepID=UPI00258CCC3B|nr:MAG: phytoene synthase [Metallosphaera javensis (ex Sakai et al. 2022)]
MNKQLDEIFKRGSTTYYNSTLFFPPRIREDVTKLYAFVRVFDDLVDSVPQRRDEFYQMRKMYEMERDGRRTGNVVLENFVELKERKGFREEWVEAFLNAMESDLHKRVYYTLDETLKYMYGSAEVIGLFMMKILDLPGEAEPYAKMLGRSMQYLNFIRDVKEDEYLGRQYLPVEDMERFGVRGLECTDKFKDFMRFQVERYLEFEREAERGYRFIPSRYLVPIKTASEMYKWTGLRISSSPCVVLSRKVKPKKRKIVLSVMKNSVGVYVWRSLSSLAGLPMLR